MFKKMIAGVLVFGMSSLFAMSLSALNSASKAELMEINGIGEVKAAAIIKERRHGKFKSFEDVQRVEGIGEQTADNIRRGVKNSDDVKKVAKKTKTKAKKKASKKTKNSKKDVEEKASKKAKKTKSKAKKLAKEKAEKPTRKRKIKSMDEKKKELKSKAKKTKTKKTKAKKTKKTKSKKKN